MTCGIRLKRRSFEIEFGVNISPDIHVRAIHLRYAFSTVKACLRML